MNSSILLEMTENFRQGLDVHAANAEPLLDAMIGEAKEPILEGLFRAWNEKGIAEDEIYSIARIMLGRCTKIRSRHERFVDIVGTGGSQSKTFNVSTAAAFVVAGAGVAVAKHGNRAATSNSGSADVLSALGIDPAVDAASAERSLNEIGICFMFAPNYHRLSPTLGNVRRDLGFPTIFNCVGPLCNPASAPHQVIGVWSKDMLPKMANALARLGTKRSWIVHGENGLDELSVIGKTFVDEIKGPEVETFELDPEDFGVKREAIDDLRVETSEHSAAMIRDVLDPTRDEFAARSLVKINAAAAIFVADGAETLLEAHQLSTESIRSGRAIMKLNQLADASKI